MIVVSLNKTKKSKGVYYRLAFKHTPQGDFRVSVGYMKEKQAEQYREICELIAQDDILGRMSTKTKAEAEKFFAKDPEFRQRLVDKGFIQVDESRKTVRELFVVNREHNTNDCKARTIRGIVNNQSHFLQFENMSECLIQEVTPEDIQRFIKFLESPQDIPILDEHGEFEFDDDGLPLAKSRKSLASSTIANILSDIRTAFNYAVKKGWLDEHPVKWDKRKYSCHKSNKTAAIQNEVLREEYVNSLMAIESTDYDFYVLKHILRWLGCRIGEAQILRWSDIDFEGNCIKFRGKDSKCESRSNYDNLPLRTVPLWPQLRPILWEAYSRELDRALEMGTAMRKHVINDTLRLSGKREFPLYRMDNWKPELITDGRYGESSAAGKKLNDELKNNGLEVYPQPCHGLRDYRANELYRQGYNINEIDAWTGNTEAVRKKHYSATAVNADDIAKALALETSRLEAQAGHTSEDNSSGDGQNPAGGGDNMAGGEMVAQESAQIASNSRESGTDLPSILANATESDLSALVEYAQQESEKRRRLGEKRNHKQLVAR